MRKLQSNEHVLDLVSSLPTSRAKKNALWFHHLSTMHSKSSQLFLCWMLKDIDVSILHRLQAKVKTLFKEVRPAHIVRIRPLLFLSHNVAKTSVDRVYEANFTKTA